jgi:hypothetical protein
MRPRSMIAFVPPNDNTLPLAYPVSADVNRTDPPAPTERLVEDVAGAKPGNGGLRLTIPAPTYTSATAVGTWMWYRTPAPNRPPLVPAAD